MKCKNCPYKKSEDVKWFSALMSERYYISQDCYLYNIYYIEIDEELFAIGELNSQLFWIADKKYIEASKNKKLYHIDIFEAPIKGTKVETIVEQLNKLPRIRSGCLN